MLPNIRLISSYLSTGQISVKLYQSANNIDQRGLVIYDQKTYE